MPEAMTRRTLLAGSVGAALAANVSPADATPAKETRMEADLPMKLGTVTYNIAKDWSLDTLIAHCKAAGFAGVELRTTHAHGVEPSLNAE
jgi:hypothetical protein